MSQAFDQLRFAFLGGGNMSEALIKGLLDQGATTADRIQVSDLLPERVVYMSETYDVDGETNPAEVIKEGADIMVLAVKPQQMDGLLETIAGGAPDALYISIAAGIPCSRIEEALGGKVRVVRVMPNTPALIGKGAAGIAGGAHATEQDLAIAETFLSAVGVVVRVDEAGIDAVTALSGSGPAYVYYLIEAMLEEADTLGFDEAKARELVCATIEGAALLARESPLPVSELRAQVTSKGGTTAAAIAAFDEGSMKEIIQRGVAAAYRRSQELSKD